MSFNAIDNIDTLKRIVEGASQSLDLFLGIRGDMFSGFPHLSGELLPKCDLNLRLICAVSRPGPVYRMQPIYYLEAADFQWPDLISEFEKLGWQTRFIRGIAPFNYMIIDRKRVSTLDYITAFKGMSGQQITSPDYVSLFVDHFNLIWQGHQSIQILYEDLLSTSIPERKRGILAVSDERWSEIIAYLAKHPEKLKTMDPFRFEELVAELLVRDGMKVKLTPRSKDGGADILAWASTNLGQQLYLVECKRYGKGNTVGVSVVRATYGCIEAARASGGMIVTTSSFSREAVSFHKTCEYRMSLKDYGAVIEWLRAHSPSVF